MSDHRPDLLRAALGQAGRLALEDQMLNRKYEYQSDFARGYFSAGRDEGRLETAREFVLGLASRHGAPRADLRARVAACADPAALRDLAIDLAAAADADTVERLLARLAPAPA